MLDAKRELFPSAGARLPTRSSSWSGRRSSPTPAAAPIRCDSRTSFWRLSRVSKEGDDIRVYLRRADMAQADALAAALPGMTFTFREGTFLLGGLVAESSSLGRRWIPPSTAPLRS